MSDKNMLFEKPVGVLARQVESDDFGPEVSIKIKFAQNGFKIRVMGQSFIAKTIEETEKLVSEQLEKLLKNLKKNDK